MLIRNGRGGRGRREEDEADATLGNWFIFTERIHHHFCKYISNCQRDHFQLLHLGTMLKKKKKDLKKKQKNTIKRVGVI